MNTSSDFLKRAIDTGRVATLRSWLESHLRPRYRGTHLPEPEDPTLVPCEYDEDQQESFNPLQRALEKGKTSVVFLLLEYGWQVTPQQENSPGLFDEFRPGGELEPTTNAQATFQAVMRYVRSHYMLKPLPKPHRLRLEALRDQLMAEEGPRLTMLRTLHTPAAWLNWMPAFLNAGASPNAHTMDPSTGATLHVLTLASTQGMVQDAKALLEAGANPLWKQHDWTTPAHTAANLTGQYNMVLSTKNMINLDIVQLRKDCLDMLLEQPGARAAQDFHGRTPPMLWDASLETLAKGWKGPSNTTTEADRVAFKEKLLGMMMPEAPALGVSRSPKPRF